MGVLTHLPNADWRNDGWTLVGTAVTKLWEALSNDDDTKYVKCPASKGQATVRFPVDVSTVPEGAVITSVTVKLRCSTGTGSAPSGTSPSITVAVSADDDTSRFVTRTIYPTSTITTFEVASYRVDALGLKWDIHRLNHILCRVFTYVSVLDLIRCYKFFCEVNYRVRPTITVDAPTGTVSTPSPVISWTYTQTDGDPQAKADYKVFTSVEQAKVAFSPENSEPVHSGTVSGDLSSLTLPTSLNPDSYWVYVRSYSSYGAKSVWVGRQFTVSGTAPGSPGVPDPDSPGTAMIRVVPDRLAGMAQLELRDTSNMLSAQDADAESAVDGPTFTSSNCNLLRDTTKAFPGGTASWKITSVASGTMTLFSDWVEIDSQSTNVTARCQFLTASSARSCRLRIQFFDASFTDLGSSLTGSSVTDATGTWKEATVTGVSVDGAVYARVAFDVLSTGGASEVHYLDRLAFMYGTSTAYSDGGHMSRNLLSSWYSTGNEFTPQAGEAWTGGPGTTVTTDTPSGTGASGWGCNKMTYVGLSPSIAFRAAGTAFNSATGGTDFTLNKPAGVVSGDLMLAFVTSSEYSTINPPVGWTLVDMARQEDGTRDTAMFVLKRSAGGSEPSSWTDGTVSVTAARRTAIVVAYSGAADAASQPLASTTAGTGNATPLYLTTPTLNNSDPNAWRVSAFALSDNASGGALTANRQQPATVPGIAYVGKGTPWGALGSSYTINRPSGVVSGDLMIAYVGVSGDATTVNVPAGWTLLSRDVANAGSSANAFTQAILYRFAGGSEPSSWSSTVSGSLGQAGCGTGSFAYRNVNATTPFVDWDTNQKVNATSITTDSVTNTNSSAWRVAAFGIRNTVLGTTMTSSETIERADVWGGYDGGWFGTDDNLTAAWYDSNGAVSTGDYTKTGTASSSWKSACSFSALLNPLAAPPAGVADETARGVATAGAADPWMTTRVFDSNGVVPTGNQSITGIWAPGSGTDLNSMVGWQGLLVPAAQVTAGYAVATMATAVDISTIDAAVLDLSGRKVAVTATFKGSVASTPFLTVNFYRANQLISSAVSQGTSFGTSMWVKSSAVFDMPEGTTRMTVGVSASDLVVSDYVLWDRVSLSLGTDTAFRPGTSRSAHPVWSKPTLEYADDRGSGYGDWAPLPGSTTQSTSFQAMTGLLTYQDHTVIPLTNRKYRAKTTSYGLAGDVFVSPVGPESSDFRFIAEKWWLKDISDPANNVQLNVKWEKVDVSTTNTATVFQPLGRDLPVVLSEGHKGDMLSPTLIPVDADEWAKLQSLLKSGRTLFLQSDVDDAWWVRTVGDLSRGVLPTAQRRENPLREAKVTFVEVEPVE